MERLSVCGRRTDMNEYVLSRVEIRGVKSKPELNGQLAFIISYDADKARVNVSSVAGSEHSQHMHSLRLECVQMETSYFDRPEQERFEELQVDRAASRAEQEREQVRKDAAEAASRAERKREQERFEELQLRRAALRAEQEREQVRKDAAEAASRAEQKREQEQFRTRRTAMVSYGCIATNGAWARATPDMRSDKLQHIPAGMGMESDHPLENHNGTRWIKVDAADDSTGRTGVAYVPYERLTGFGGSKVLEPLFSENCDAQGAAQGAHTPVRHYDSDTNITRHRDTGSCNLYECTASGGV